MVLHRVTGAILLLVSGTAIYLLCRGGFNWWSLIPGVLALIGLGLAIAQPACQFCGTAIHDARGSFVLARPGDDVEAIVREMAARRKKCGCGAQFCLRCG